jgi:hypothetical protein
LNSGLIFAVSQSVPASILIDFLLRHEEKRRHLRETVQRAVSNHFEVIGYQIGVLLDQAFANAAVYSSYDTIKQVHIFSSVTPRPTQETPSKNVHV